MTMRNGTNLHRIPLLLGFLVFLAASPVLAQIENVQVSNITSSSVTISWSTDEVLDGCVNYGLTTSLGVTECDVRPNGELHVVQIDGLAANSTYYFEVVSGAYTDDNGGTYYSVTTTSAGAGTPYVVYGTVLLSDSVSPAYDKLVIGAVISGGVTSYPLSYLTSATGTWVLNLGNLKNPVTGGVLSYGVGDTVLISVFGGSDGFGADTVLISGSSPQNAGTIILLLNNPPEITCPSDTIVSTDHGVTVVITATDPDGDSVTISAEDLMPGATFDGISFSWTAGCGDVGVYTVRFIAWDGELSDTCYWIITIVDTTPPEITCPADVTVDCGGSTDPSATGYPTVSDDCDPVPSSGYADSQAGNVITRTWTATDVSGNSSSCDQLITLTDTTPPEITCPADVTVDCGGSTDPSATGYPTVTDDCDPNPSSGYADSQAGNVITRTWTATDVSGNSSSCDQLITLTDTTPPEITCPADVTVDCGGSTDPSATGYPVVTDDCDPNPSSGYADSQAGNVITRTWTATDVSGNSSSCDQLITLTDTTPPEITCPADVTVDCGGSTDPSSTGYPVVTDDCDPNPSSGYADSQAGNVITRTWTATDVSGNSSSCDQLITLTDTTPPEITCPADVTVDCGGSTDPSSTGYPVVTDDCDPNPSSGYADSQVGNVITRTWTATDVSGNSSSCDQLITLTDTTPPEITCPADVTVDCGGSIDPSATGYPVMTDDCDPNPSSGYADSQAGNVITRTWTATDVSGNSSSCDQLITLTDTTPPEITCPADVTVDCGGSTDPSSTGYPVMTDDCDPAPSSGYADSQAGNVITRTWTATDVSGNSSSCDQLITLTDTTPPEITCPADVTVDCGGSTDPSSTGYPVMTDDCDPAPSSGYADSQAGNVITRTWTATDVSGNSSSCDQLITLTDTTPPEITCPADVTVDCGGSTDPSSTGYPVMTDDCDPAPSSGYADSQAGNVITRTWTATDVSGNSSSCDQLITLTDTTPPEITCPADVTVDCGGSTDPSSTGYPVVTDDCDPAPSSGYADSQAGNVITRTWTATDASGNSSSCDQLVTLTDTTPPEITCPADVTVDCGGSTDPSSTGYPTVTDDCDPNPSSGYADSQSGNVITRTWTATDVSGNSSSCDQLITLTDTTPPEITCPADVTVDCGGSIDPSSTGYPTVTDDCDPAPSSGYADSQSGNVITRTWTATDVSGNSSSCDQLITLTDTTPPEITCPADVTVDCGGSTDPSSTGYPVVTDDCDPAPSSGYADSQSGNVITRTWTATDVSGNSSSCDQLVTLTDTTPPEITCPADVTVDCGGSTDPSSTGYPVVTDDCDPNPSSGYADSQVGNVITRTWTATDVSGNSSSCDQLITLTDTTPPEITCPADVTVDCGGSTDPSATGYPTVTDDCDPNPSSGYADSQAGNVITRTWTATDVSGNSSSCDQLITLTDTTPPEITCPADVTVDCGGSTDPSATGYPVVTDDCDPNPSSGYADSQAGNVITRTWTATDVSGNSSSCDQLITLTDTTPPEITCPADVTVDCGGSTDPSSTGYPVVTDDCDPNPSSGYADSQVGNVITRTWTATDVSGNSSSCDQLITLTDTTPPEITCPADVTVDCGGSIDPSATGYPVMTDDCDPNPSSGYADSQAGNVITRTWTATDVSGNSSSCDQLITLTDTTPPEITCPADVTVDCGGSTDPSSTGYPVMTDDCDPAPSSGYADSQAGNVITRTWTATDVSGNSSSCDQLITLTDTTPPEITCPADVTVDCGGSTDPSSTGYPVMTDDCDPAPSSGYADSQAGNVITRTWTATDVSGNSSSCDQLITLTDTTPPEITCPADVTVDCGGSTDPSSTGYPVMTDDCDPAPSSGYADSQAGNVITRTWTATDVSGNSSSCDQLITLTDTTPPEITCPADVTVDCGGSTDPSSTGYPVMTDDCDPAPSSGYADSQAGNVITRTWTATDVSGNSSSCDQLITLTDTTPPEITCPADVTVDCGGSTDPSSTGYPVVTDDCDPAPSSGYADSQAGNVITRTWTATDASGNSSSCDQLVTLTDTTPPEITCPADVTVDCGGSTDPSSTGYPTVTDDCDPNPSSGYADSQSGNVITRTWTATDVSGNSSSCDQLITLTDTTPPEITCPADVTVDCGGSIDPSSTGYPTVTDDCDPAPSSGYADSQSGNVITRTWTATDVSGNSSSCDQLITLTDTTPPEITCPADVTVDCGGSTDPSSTGYPVVTDDCDPAPSSGYADSQSGNVITRTWTATDVSGNSSSCDQLVTLTDTTPPEITCPADVTVDCGGSTDPSSTGYPVMTDDCDPNPSSGYADSQVGNVITRTWTATDVSGNSSSCDQLITLTDTTPPEITCPADVTVDCGGSIDPSATGYPVMTDDCDPNPSSGYADSQAGNVITRTWTATDVSGNSSSCDQLITLTDTTPPEITCPADVTVDCGGSIDPSATGYPVVSDDCDPAPSSGYADSQAGNVITRTWTATDVSGNSSSCDQLITLTDTTPPEITCPADVTVDCGGSTDPSSTGYPVMTDDCDPAPSSGYADSQSGNVITRTWTATDVSGNSSSCDQLITLTDTTPPEITCPADTLVVLSNEPGEVCIELQITGYDSVAVDGASWSDGQLCFYSIPDSTYVFAIVAVNDCGTDICKVIVAIRAAVELYIDIKPRSCPNPLNLKGSKGDGTSDQWFAHSLPYVSGRAPVLPVAILGTSALDVGDIDPSSVMLEGVPLLRWSYQDVSTPVGEDAEECECTTAGADGFLDLALKFDKQSIVDALGDVHDGDVIPLTLTAQLSHGREAQGIDCVIIRCKIESADLLGADVGGDSTVAVFGNFPNPFNPITTISFNLARSIEYSVTIYNIAGQVVRSFDGMGQAGLNQITWNASENASGVYFYRLITADVTAMKKMVLLK